MNDKNTIDSNPFANCFVCGRSIDELRPFTIEDFRHLELPFDVILFGHTPDRKLARTWRKITFNWIDTETGEIVEQTQAEKSWECFECLSTDPELIEAIIREQDWFSISQDELHDEFPDQITEKKD